jgi:hypothetical protein
MAFLGMTVGGWAGWWVGAHAGLMAAWVLGMVGTGAGLYLGRRIAEGWG